MKKILLSLFFLIIAAFAEDSVDKHFFEMKIGYDISEKLTIKDKQYAMVEVVKDFYMQNKIVFKVVIKEFHRGNKQQIEDSIKYILIENFSLNREDPQFITKIPVKYDVSEIMNFKNIKNEMKNGRSSPSLDLCEEYFRMNDGDNQGWAYYIYDSKNEDTQKDKCIAGIPNFTLKKLDL